MRCHQRRLLIAVTAKQPRVNGLELFLVRHGETESNRRGLALGRADLRLNDQGRWQIGRLAEALKSQPFTAIYSSPLARTMATAEAIAAEQSLEVQAESGLIEMDIGEAEGLTFAEVRERFPALIQNWGGPDGPTFRMPGGERLVDVQSRAEASVERLLETHPGEAVCAVTHNFVILSLVAAALKIDLAEFRRLRHGVAAITVLEINSTRARVLRLNDTCHLHSDDGQPR